MPRRLELGCNAISSRTTRRTLLQGAAASAVVASGGLVPAWALGDALRTGDPAPPATLTTLDGEQIATRALLGNVVILTFWATWCVPCREELPLLSAYLAQHRSDGLRILGFGLDGPEHIDAVRVVAQKLTFPVGLLGDTRLPGYGRIWRIPVSFTIDRQGRLADDGWRDKHPVWTQERLDRIVTPLLVTA
jgi:cytochrome c biogenesis protein CcmG, thiol:disulfide interchange protein DsbE